jgi:hypothetical protein
MQQCTSVAANASSKELEVASVDSVYWPLRRRVQGLFAFLVTPFATILRAVPMTGKSGAKLR